MHVLVLLLFLSPLLRSSNKFFLHAVFVPSSCYKPSRFPSKTNGKLSLNEGGAGDGASVGDYVKGVHGGKYQFDAPGMNLMGSEFAQSLYSSSGQEEEEDDGVDEPMPRWAQNMGNTLLADDSTCKEILSLSKSNYSLQVTIRNQERTWEPFYAKILGDQTSSVVVCAPMNGKLAPLGGATNPFDPRKPYSDSAIITVKRVDFSSPGICYLAIGTEEEKLFYKILLQ